MDCVSCQGHGFTWIIHEPMRTHLCQLVAPEARQILAHGASRGNADPSREALEGRQKPRRDTLFLLCRPYRG